MHLSSNGFYKLRRDYLQLPHISSGVQGILLFFYSL